MSEYRGLAVFPGSSPHDNNKK